MTTKDAPQGTPRRLWRGLAAAGALVLVLGSAGLALREAGLGARLVRSDPDQIASDPGLMAFGVSRGEAVFKQHCANCHAAGLRKSGTPDLADQDYLYGQGLVSETERVVHYGIRAHNPRTWNLAEMPAYATPRPAVSEPGILPLKPDDIGDVVEYLRHLEARPFDAARASRGATIYAGRGGCYDCHAADAQGDPAIGAPNLTDRIWLHGDGERQAVADVIAHGAHGLCPAWVGRLSPLRIRQVALYVHTLSHPPVAAPRKQS